MRDHNVFVIHYTQRQSQGRWYNEDDYEHLSWSEPKPLMSLYVASKAEVAKAHWDYWSQYSGGKDSERTFVKIEDLGQPTLLLEIAS